MSIFVKLLSLRKWCGVTVAGDRVAACEGALHSDMESHRYEWVQPKVQEGRKVNHEGLQNPGVLMLN